jgi:hypothetical protein
MVMLDRIERVVDCPVLDHNGKICRKGYHKHLNGGTYITGGEVEDIPLEEAIESIKDMFSEYNFASPADRLRAIAMLFTPAIAQGGLITGPFPIDVAEADQSQSGKTYRHKVTAAVYNETLSPITRSKDGVGRGIDEAFASCLLSGRPFIQIDNYRGKVDSQLIEACITSEQAEVRVPYRGLTNVSTKGVSIMLTSNGVELTSDLANRCCIIRIRYREGFKFKQYNEGDLLDHVQTNQGYYLGCVFAVLKAWTKDKKPTDYDNRHSFRKWSSALNWITREFFTDVEKAEPTRMLDGHAEIQKRTSNPFEAILRSVAIQLKEEDKLGDLFNASELVDIVEGDTPNTISGKDDAAKAQSFGRQIATLYRKAGKDVIRVEEFAISRETRTNSNREQVKYYRFNEA